MNKTLKNVLKYATLGLLGGAPALGAEVLSEKILEQKRKELDLDHELNDLRTYEDEEEDEDL